ncbi:MAG TPA: hypothetical protein VF041_17415 [Gemmatimonadaceae bacterium]
MRIHITHRLIAVAAVVSLVSLAACGTSPTAVPSDAGHSTHPRVSSTRAATAGDSPATLDAAEETSSSADECDATLDESCRAIMPWY